MRVSFEIPGPPAPKGSRNQFGGEANPRTKAWVDGASLLIRAKAKGKTFGTKPVHLRVIFECPRPKRPTYDHPTRGDADKFARACCDALERAGVVKNDTHVVDIHATKRYADNEPRTYGYVVEYVEDHAEGVTTTSGSVW